MVTDNKSNRQIALECATWANLDEGPEQILGRAEQYLGFLENQGETATPDPVAMRREYFNSGLKYAEGYLLAHLDYLAELWQTQGKQAVVDVIQRQAKWARA